MTNSSPLRVQDAKSLAAPRRENVADSVYAQLKNMILSSQVAPRQRLNIEDLSRRLGVSPTPVRESLARLEADELTIKLPLRGYTTSGLLDARQVTDLYGLRLMIEVPSAGIAASKVSEHQITQLSSELASAGTVSADRNFASFGSDVDHDARFHKLVLDIADNEMVTRAFVRTHCHLHLFRLAYDEDLGGQLRVEHATIADAVGAGDRTAAEDAMRRHLTQSRDRVLDKFGDR